MSKGLHDHAHPLNWTNGALIIAGAAKLFFGDIYPGTTLIFLGIISWIAHFYQTPRLWAMDLMGIMVVFISLSAPFIGNAIAYSMVVSVVIYSVIALVTINQYNSVAFTMIGIFAFVALIVNTPSMLSIYMGAVYLWLKFKYMKGHSMEHIVASIMFGFW